MSFKANPIRERSIGGNVGRFIQRGDGSPLVLVASQLVRIQPYYPVLLRLADHFQVTLLELPGCGGGSKLRGWSCEQYAIWLSRFLEEEQIERPLLVAHSTSCGAAIVLGAEGPNLISGMILTGSIGIPRPILAILLGRAIDGLLEWSLSLRRWIDIAHTAIFHTKNFFHQIRIAASHDLRENAKRVAVPTLLAHGRRDHTIPLSSAATLHQLIPNSHLYISPTGSHDWLITNPDEFTEMTKSFASTLGTASSLHVFTSSRFRLTPSPHHSPTPR